MGNILTKISNKHGCDKSDKRHGYTVKYHRYFKDIKDSKFNMLEFGFGVGSSVKVWLEYFTKANLVSVDFLKELPKDKLIMNYIENKRFEFLSANQIDKEKIIKIFDKYENFYLVIDDASHKAEDQQYTFSFSFPYVVPGGWYVIEDLKCRRTPNQDFKIEADKTLKVLEAYLKTKKFRSKILTPKQNQFLTKNIESVQIYDKIAFIKKRGNI